MVNWWNNWAPVLLDGLVGTVLGLFGVFVAAVWLVKRQVRADRRLARMDRELTAAMTLYPIVADVRSTLIDANNQPNRPRICSTTNSVRDKLFVVLIAAESISSEVVDELNHAIDHLRNARGQIAATDDQGTREKKYLAGNEKAITALGSALMFISLLAERDGAIILRNPPRRRLRSHV